MDDDSKPVSYVEGQLDAIETARNVENVFFLLESMYDKLHESLGPEASLELIEKLKKVMYDTATEAGLTLD